MSDHWADTSGLRAGQAGRGPAGRRRPSIRTGRRSSRSLRFSRARHTLLRGAQPDMLAEPLDADFQARLEKLLGPLKASETAAGPADALAAARPLPPKAEDEDRVVYLVSDFRANQVARARRPAQSDCEARSETACSCTWSIASTTHARQPGDRLAAARAWRAGGGGAAIGRNRGAEFRHDAGPASLRFAGGRWPRPAGARDRGVPPGKSVARRFPVLFATAGEHEISARLQDDAVAADNSRSLVRRRAQGGRRAGDRRRRARRRRLLPCHGPGTRRQDRQRAEAARSNRRSSCATMRSMASRRSICSISLGSNRPRSPRSSPTSKRRRVGHLHGRAVAGRLLQRGTLPRRPGAVPAAAGRARPNCWSTAWKNRPTWKSPTIQFFRSSPESATAS